MTTITPMQAANQQVLMVNSVQLTRIMKRRIERTMREVIRPTQPRQRYLHESRHKHAVRRQRGQKGRFAHSATEEEGESLESEYVA
mmetsp:Transcript_42490/g.93111  ORF Transcript_42490/g.93111 Transcript_42490/m.93111 type:complete len:86 (+) Transcript_42490:90-347(+)